MKNIQSIPLEPALKNLNKELSSREIEHFLQVVEVVKKTGEIMRGMEQGSNSILD